MAMLTPSCVVLNDLNCKLGYLWGCWEQDGAQWSDKERQDEPSKAPKREERRGGEGKWAGLGPYLASKISNLQSTFLPRYEATKYLSLKT